VTTLLLYAILCAAAYYLLARALITKVLWSRYPAWLDRLMMCSACTGTWLGLGCGFLGRWLELPLLGLAPGHPFTIVAAAASGMVLTPLLVYPLLLVLESLGPAEDVGGDPRSIIEEAMSRRGADQP
jgi:hypothetical protein